MFSLVLKGVVVWVPLLEGKENISRNISELMAAYKKKGKIGKSRPKTKKDALEQAIAIALKQSRS